MAKFQYATSHTPYLLARSGAASRDRSAILEPRTTLAFEARIKPMLPDRTTDAASIAATHNSKHSLHHALHNRHPAAMSSAIASTSAAARVSLSSQAAKSAPARRAARVVVRANAQQSQQPELSRRAAASLLLIPASLTLSKSGAHPAVSPLVPVAPGERLSRACATHMRN